MQLSHPTFELLGGSRADEEVLLIGHSQKPENGIRIQGKAILEDGKIIAKNLQPVKGPGSKREWQKWWQEPENQGRSNQARMGWPSSGRAKAQQQTGYKTKSKISVKTTDKIMQGTKEPKGQFWLLSCFSNLLDVSVPQRSVKTGLLNIGWPLESACTKAQAPTQTNQIRIPRWSPGSSTFNSYLGDCNG